MNEFEFVFRTEPRAIQSVRFCRIGEHVRTYQPRSNTDWKNFIRREFYPMDTTTGKFDFSKEPEIVYSEDVLTFKIEND